MRRRATKVAKLSRFIKRFEASWIRQSSLSYTIEKSRNSRPSIIKAVFHYRTLVYLDLKRMEKSRLKEERKPRSRSRDIIDTTENGRLARHCANNCSSNTHYGFRASVSCARHVGTVAKWLPRLMTWTKKAKIPI